MRFTLLGASSTREEVFNFLKKGEPLLANKGFVITDLYAFTQDEAAMVAATICQELGMNVFLNAKALTPNNVVKVINDLKIRVVFLFEPTLLPLLKKGVKHSWVYVGVVNDKVKSKNIKVKSRYFEVDGDSIRTTQSTNNIRARKDVSRLQLPDRRRKSLV